MPEHLLILSAGRRCLLVQYFQEALRRSVPGAKVIAGDMSPELSSACQMADQNLRTSEIHDPEYINQLLKLCEMNQIRLVIPTIDTDLLLLAENRARFAERGIEVLVSDADLVRQCRDKRQTTSLFARHEISSPTQVDPLKETKFPLIAKPYDGSSSTNLHVVDSVKKLSESLLSDSKIVFFEYLSHEEHDEYTIDMYFDRDGFLKCFVPRLRMATRAGEVSKSRTEKLPALMSMREKFRHLPGARGCIAMQLFVCKRDNQLYGIEINPRFGGGFPLSYEAGAKYPTWIVAEYFHHEKIQYYDAWKDQLTMLRYDAHVLVPSAA